MVKHLINDALCILSEDRTVTELMEIQFSKRDIHFYQCRLTVLTDAEAEEMGLFEEDDDT